MGLLDITLGAEDAQMLTGAALFVGGAAMMFAPGGQAAGAMMMTSGAGMAASGAVTKDARQRQESAQADMQSKIERDRIDALSRALGAEAQANQVALAMAQRGRNNNSAGQGVDTSNNTIGQATGSSTSGTF